MQAMQPKVQDFLASLPYPAQTRTFHHTPLEDLIQIRTLSSNLSADVAQYYKAAFGSARLYGVFFPEQGIRHKFRKQVAQAGALLSGEAILHILNRDDTEPTHIDVYAPHTQTLPLGHILEEAAYKFMPLPTRRAWGRTYDAQPPVFEPATRAEFSKGVPNTADIDQFCDDSTVAGVFVFKNSKEKTIRLISTRSQPIEPILSFHSTILMNFATSTQYFSLYPKTTFVDKRILKLQTPTHTIQNVHAEFEKKGWSVFGQLTGEQSLHPDHELSLQTRWVGDTHTWIIDMDAIDEAEDEYQTLRVTSWDLGSYDIAGPQIILHRLESRYLLSSYTMSAEAEQAVWRHPCFRRIHGNRQGTIRYPLEDAPSERYIKTLASKKTNSSSTASALSNASTAEQNQHLYTNAINTCTHREINGNFDLEDALVEYLKELYPLMANTHRENSTFRQLRNDLADVRQAFGTISHDILHPSAYTISMLLQFIDDCRRITKANDTRVSFHYLPTSRANCYEQFWLQYSLETASMRILVTCIFSVPKAQRQSIQRELAIAPGWSEDMLLEASIIIAFEDCD
ncbi:hypothetical protein VNI00_011522 [Paramarasmius palmivorus]|uniref:Uncharacterized protein n=1 Tax=Paramarasmius palmivorus TaxID=297713 RepID=A0AAW0CC67_9AGAR